MKIIEEGIDYVDTSDGYCSGVIFYEGNLILPTINLGILKEHPLNETDSLLHIDFGYIFIEKVHFLKSSEEEEPSIGKSRVFQESESKFFTGESIEQNKFQGEIEVQADNYLLILRDDYCLSKEIWVPNLNDTLNSNISKKVAINFFESGLNIKL